jgi:hypothetical protein
VEVFVEVLPVWFPAVLFLLDGESVGERERERGRQKKGHCE